MVVAVAPVLHNKDPVKPEADKTELPQLLVTATAGLAGIALGAAIPEPAELMQPFTVWATVYVPFEVVVILSVVAPVFHKNVAAGSPVTVNNVLPQLLLTETDGAEGIGLAVNTAALEVTVPPLLVHTAWYCLLLSAVVVANDKVLAVAPGMFVQVVPLVLSCHCTVGAGPPLAPELKITLSPAHFVCDAG